MTDDFSNEVCKAVKELQLILAGEDSGSMLSHDVGVQIQQLVAPEDHDNYLHALNAELHRAGLLSSDWIVASLMPMALLKISCNASY